MKRSLLNKWLKALESGEFKQRRKQLGSEKLGFCCLGLLCHIAKVPFKASQGELPPEFARDVGMGDEGVAIIEDDDIGCLAAFNDEGKSFSEIAAIIRTNPLRFIRSIEP